MPIPALEERTTTALHDSRSRTWTVDHIPFDELPAFEPGMRSPVFVSLEGWQLNWYGDVLYVFNPDAGTHHDLHGAKGFTTYDDARRAWYNAGVLGLWVYEDVAADYGLPTTLAWTRQQPDIDTTEYGDDARRVTKARTAQWWRPLDPYRDLTRDVWDGHDELYAVVAISAYGAVTEDDPDDAPTFVEIEYGLVVCIDPDQPGDEIVCRYTYDQIAGVSDTSDEALDGYLAADIVASLRNLGASDDTVDDTVWNNSIDHEPWRLGAAA